MSRVVSLLTVAVLAGAQFIFHIPPLVSAAFYVNNGVSCSDTGGQPGTDSQPWCTVSYGVSRISGGQTLYVKNGTYAGDFTITGPSGSSGAHTVISAYPGHFPVLDHGTFANGRIKISHGCSYIDFVGFVITNHNQGLYLDDDAGTDVPCDHVTVDGITVHDVGQEGIAVRAGSATAARNITIKNSLIYNTGRIGSSQNGEGIYVGNSSGTDNTNTVTLLNNTIHDTQDECIELKGDSHDVLVDGNTLYNCLTTVSSFGDTGGAIEIDAPRNSVTNPNHIIRNNTIHDVVFESGKTKRGIHAMTGASIYNNVLYNIDSSYDCIRSDTSNYTRLIYYNTINCGTTRAVVNSGTTIDSRNNIGPATAGTNIAYTASYFVDSTTNDYRLHTGSSPINIGADLTATAPTDKNGVIRPTGSSTNDAGAFEGPFAATFTAASCSNAAIDTALALAASGGAADTVAVPSGTCTWTAPITLSGKPIVLSGAGIGTTNITYPAAGALAITCSATNFTTVTGFTFTSGASALAISIGGTQFDVCFRVHDIRLVITTAASHAGFETEGVYGLIDHVTIDQQTSGTSVQVLSMFGDIDGSQGGYVSWQQPLSMGTNKAVYLEDSTITYPAGAAFSEDAIDAYGGARLVIRYNTINNDSIGFHGTDSGDRRSPVSFEIYNNTFSNNSGSTLRAGTVRGGTGVIFNNTFTTVAHGWGGVALMLYRACNNLDKSAWGFVDGTNYAIGSTNFAAQASRQTHSTTGAASSSNVLFCSGNKELVCSTGTTCSSAGAGTCTAFFDGSGTAGYPGRDQPGIAPGQTVDPIYLWSNGSITAGGEDAGETCGAGITTWIQSGRDYVNNGTTAKPGYTAYTYPHPLQGGR